MDWANPYYLIAIVPAAGLLWVFHRFSIVPASLRRTRLLLGVRIALVLLLLLALSAPAIQRPSTDPAVIFVLDHSQSQGREGMTTAYQRAAELARRLPRGTPVGFVSAGQNPLVLGPPMAGGQPPAPDFTLPSRDGGQSDLAAALNLAQALFPPDHARRVVLVGDGQETVGDLTAAASDAAAAGVSIDAVPVAGPRRPDARILRLRTSQGHSYEGASITLEADVDSTLEGTGRIRLYQNGIELEKQSRSLTLKAGEAKTVTFRVAPEQRNLYTYRAVLEGFKDDTLPQNDQAAAIIDVRGKPVLLYIEGEPDQAYRLAESMMREGIRLHVRPASAFPKTLAELAGYDGVIVSDVPAHVLGAEAMGLVRDYVEHLGGGFLMIGGVNSFGAGAYYRTPIEELLPVKMKAPDKEVRSSTALALVLDRSGSMGDSNKLEICKSAAIASVELLTSKDFVNVVAFDTANYEIVPMTPVTNIEDIKARIGTINVGGGTNMYPSMSAAYQSLRATSAKIKHMILLTDGQTDGQGFDQLAQQANNDGITISAVAIGHDAATQLLQTIAAIGKGKYYETSDFATLPQIFTQDTMVYAGRMIREESFQPKQVENHPMLRGWPADKAPALLGYVKTNRKVTAQVPLVTDMGDPLLAHWRFGLGKVTAFTSDCKSRWSPLWLTTWQEGYNQFWAQVLREMARQPQGRFMDLRFKPVGEQVAMQVDLLADAARFKNDAEVTAEVFYQPMQAGGEQMTGFAQARFAQDGPGSYSAKFRPDQPGVYLVRARAGAQMISAAYVHQVSPESATGTVNESLLKRVTAVAGGQLLPADVFELPARAVRQPRFIELQPWLIIAFLLLVPLDVVIRRWEHILGFAESIREWRGGRK